MDLEQTHIYGASIYLYIYIYQSPHDTGILSKKIYEESIQKSIFGNFNGGMHLQVLGV